jgi:hypothetical protein
VVALKVGNSNGPGKPRCLHSLKAAPSRLDIFGCRDDIWIVEEVSRNTKCQLTDAKELLKMGRELRIRSREHIQIDIIQLKSLQAFFQCLGHVTPAFQDLCGDEKLVSGDPALLYRDANLTFGTIRVGRVEMSESFLQGGLQHLDELGIERVVGVILVPGGSCSESELGTNDLVSGQKI